MRFKLKQSGVLLGSILLLVLLLDGENNAFAKPGNGDEPVDHSPSVGQSVFDKLFRSARKSGEYSIPYPFSRVASSLEEKLGISINGDANSMKSVFVPLGRCINRYAGQPDYFRYPRLVVAVDSEHYGENYIDQPFLKDRIFIGYQEISESMEVISYNDEAGRFEFQVVSDYGENTEPKVSYAKRSDCIACHQNSGPIFAQAPWDETDQNQGIYQLLVDSLPEGAGIIPPILRSNAVEIDGASNRANLFAMFQQFWKGACDTESVIDSIRCRAGMLELVLRYRLQEQSRAIQGSHLVSNYFAPLSSRTIPEIWPNGISVLSSDIPNRNPLLHGAVAHLESAERLKEPRSIMITWNPEDLYRGIEGLGKMIPLADMHRLDQQLYDVVATVESTAVQLEGDCTLVREDKIEDLIDRMPQTGDISFSCRLSKGSLSLPYEFFGDLYVEHGELRSLPVFSRLILDSQSRIIGLTHSGGKILQHGNQWKIGLDFRDSRQQFHARLPGVGIVDQIEVTWPRQAGKDVLFDTNIPVSGSARLTLLPDMDVLDLAITLMIEDEIRGKYNYFSAQPFRGSGIMDVLMKKLEDMHFPQS